MANRDVQYAWVAKNAGFTLIELLVSLSVIGVAVAVYVSLYTSSLEIGESARNRELAIGLAKGQLYTITEQPETFLWKVASPLDLEQFEVKLAEDDPKAGNPFSLPASMPADKRAYTRQERIYEKFRWKAFGQFSALDAAYLQVTVTVYWTEASKERVVALSSLIPRSRVEGLSP